MLKFKTPKKRRKSTFWRPCSIQECNSSGRYTLTIMGYDAGEWCEKHKKQFEKLWEANLGSVPLVKGKDDKSDTDKDL